MPQVRHVPEWFPGAGFQKKASQWRVTVDRLRDAPYDATMKRLVSTHSPPNGNSSHLFSPARR